MAAEKYDVVLDRKIDELHEKVDLLIKMVARLQDDLKKVDERSTRSRSEVRQVLTKVLGISHREDPEQRREREAVDRDTRQQHQSPHIPYKEK